MIYNYKGQGVELVSYKKAAYVAFPAGCAVTLDTSGLLVPADANTAKDAIVGIMPTAIDKDHPLYDKSVEVTVEVPTRGSEFLADVGNGDGSKVAPGTLADLTSSDTVDLAPTTPKGIFKVVRPYTTKKVFVTFNV